MTAQECKAPVVTVDLGHRFMTDILELRFSGPLALQAGSKLWVSLLYALLEGASTELGIRRDDLDGTIYYHAIGDPPSLVLFDNVPGGAGHTQRVKDHLNESLAAAFERVAGCECGLETSCYECLRSYQNQHFHDQLVRGEVVAFLRTALVRA